MTEEKREAQPESVAVVVVALGVDEGGVDGGGGGGGNCNFLVLVSFMSGEKREKTQQQTSQNGR